MKHKETILEEAQKLVYGDRNKDYGHPLDDFSRTAAMATGMLSGGMFSGMLGLPSGILKPGCKINPEHVGLFMILVKVSRQMNRPKRDNLVDIAGYAATVQMCIDETLRRNKDRQKELVKHYRRESEVNRLLKKDRENRMGRKAKKVKDPKTGRYVKK